MKPADPRRKMNFLHAIVSAYAGHGLGLCSDYTNVTRCQDEQQNMPDEIVMAVLFTRSALTVSLSPIKAAYGLWEPPYRRIINFKLSHDSRRDIPDEKFYWEAVKDRLCEVIISNPYSPRPNRLILFGESSGNEKFRSTLNESLASLMDKLSPVLDEYPMFVTARGAAEFAKRGLWSQAHPRMDHIYLY